MVTKKKGINIKKFILKKKIKKYAAVSLNIFHIDPNYPVISTLKNRNFYAIRAIPKKI